MSVCYEKSGMKITQLRDRGSEFFTLQPLLAIKKNRRRR
jgi:hypothetical protein